LILAVVLTAGASASILKTIEDQIYQSIMAGDYPKAAEQVEKYLKFSPHDAVMLYNAACIYCQLGQPERGASSLQRAVNAGLVDLDQIRRDPDLEPLHDHPIYKEVVRRLEQTSANQARDALGHWKALYGRDDYRYSRDEDRRIAYATALDPTSHTEMLSMVERQADYHQSSLFNASPSTFLLIAIPTTTDARKLFKNEQTGGIYEHHKRRLISRDTGSSLRHELVHAYHYAHMDQLGQRHPLWVQEGLASLHESYVFEDDGSITFLPNERHNLVRGRAKAGTLTSWTMLLRMNDEEFMAGASRNYPQVRSIFEFLADRGKLDCWYEALIGHYEDDSTGALAFRACFNLPLDDIERAWRRWVIGRPNIDIEILYGDAALGIASHPRGTNDGVVISDIVRGSPAAASRLEIGDIIVSVDDQPTRTLTELMTIIGAKKNGDTVTIRARHNREYFTVVVSLRPLGPIMR
jgi:hypothetical protein